MTEPNRWSYCGHCDGDMIVCGMCGNNCCNGGSGEVFGPNPGEMVPCPQCDAAYAEQAKGKPVATEEPQ